MEKNRFWAKWRHTDHKFQTKSAFQYARGLEYTGHLCEVLMSLNYLFGKVPSDEDTPTHMPVKYLGKEGDFPSLGHALHHIMDLDVSVEDLYQWCWLACLAHDLGKAGREFQHMIQTLEDGFQEHIAKHPSNDWNGRHFTSGQAAKKWVEESGYKGARYTQMYRHEYLSLVLLTQCRVVKKWFKAAAGGERGFKYVVAGAAAHHLKCFEGRAFKPVVADHDYREGHKFEKLAEATEILVKNTKINPKGITGCDVVSWEKLRKGLESFKLSENRIQQGLADLGVEDKDDKVSVGLPCVSRDVPFGWLGTFRQGSWSALRKQGCSRSLSHPRKAIPLRSALRKQGCSRVIPLSACRSSSVCPA